MATEMPHDEWTEALDRLAAQLELLEGALDNSNEARFIPVPLPATSPDPDTRLRAGVLLSRCGRAAAVLFDAVRAGRDRVRPTSPYT